MLEPERALEAAMGEQAVIAHADADIDGYGVKRQHDHKPLPTEKEQRCQGADVKCSNCPQGDPVNACALGRGAPHANLLPGGNIMGMGWRG